MAEPLTSQLEQVFVDGFLPGDRAAASAVLDALKSISANLPVRLEGENIGVTKTRTFPRIHGVLETGKQPILWSMCAPCSTSPTKRSHQKVELLTRETPTLKKARVLREIEAIGKPVGIRLGDAKVAPVLMIGITSGITRAHAGRIADAVAKIAAVVLPLYA